MMAFCKNCGAELDGATMFCANCGMRAGGESSQHASAGTAQDGYAPDSADIEKNKVMAGLAYILFFLPLLVCPDSRFGRFHANQGLLLLLFGVIVSAILGIIPIIGWILLIFFPIVVLILAVIGLMNGLNGRMKELPVIGKMRIIK